MRSLLKSTAAVAALATLISLATPQPAPAARECKTIGELNSAHGRGCDVLSHPKELLKIGKNFVTGHISTALKEFLGGGGGASASTALSLAVIGAWIIGGAKVAVTWMVKEIQSTAAPQLGTVWFSSTYWRVAGIAALLTLPFLFAAAVQALLRSDLTVLSRAAFGYLPLAMLCVGIAAPLTMLLLAGTDELCSIVWTSSSSHGLAWLLTKSAGLFALAALKSRFLGFLFGLLTAAGAVLVWLELLMREAAVYVVVLLLPLAFAALVWPARRVWALRAAELLVALILSKFAIVAVLGLGGMALSHGAGNGVGAVLAGMVLVILAAFAPWAVLRLVPLAEVASGAASALSGHFTSPFTEAYGQSKVANRTYEGAMSNLAAYIERAARNANGNSSALTNSQPGEQASEPSVGASAREPSAGENSALEDRREPFVGATGNGHLAEQAVDQGHAGSYGADASAEGTADGPSSDERIPGAAPMWQAPDMSWRPLNLGNDEGWPPAPLWTNEGASGSGTREGGGGPSTGPAAENAPKPGPEPAVEDADPLPPGQDGGGPL